jgi:hypothetical protein
MNEIFSSRVLDANVDRSKKLRVEMASEEKYPWLGNVLLDNRVSGVGVISALTRAKVLIYVSIIVN